jgi:lipopolysaccharide/colanic/teichoic acid biosynthesis glycosyltransferase
MFPTTNTAVTHAASRRESSVSRGLAGYAAIKRALDLGIALVLIVATAPVVAVCMVLIRLGSRGSPLYKQQRLGRGGRVFTIYKIRTMVQDCERDTGPVWSRPGDCRVTLIGRFLRWSHLDELPQLYNVITGDMSLIGPRPERPEIATQLEHVLPRYSERSLVLPGLSGLAQVMQPPDTDLESVRRKLEYDLLYVERMTLAVDMRICLATVLHLAHVPAGTTVRLMGGVLERQGSGVATRRRETATTPRTHPAPARIAPHLLPPQPLPAAGGLH